MKNQRIRAFIAVELPEELKSTLLQLQTEMKSDSGNFVKWVAPESIHVTLKFLGDIFPRMVKDVAVALEEASRGNHPFFIEIKELGAFPNLRQPRVLWVGMGGELGKLIDLQQCIDDALASLGFAREKRPFSPHITLARIRDWASLQDRRHFGSLVEKKNFEVEYKVDVNGFSLMRSQLFPTGAIYNCLAEIKLKSLNER